MSEQSDSAAQANKPGLSEQALRSLKHIVDDEPIADGDHGLQELVDMHAVVPNTHSPGHWILLDPQQTAHNLLWNGITEVTGILNRLAKVPKITEVLAVEHDRGKWRDGVGSKYFDDPDQINAQLDKIMAGATEELLTAQPRKRSKSLLTMAMPRDVALLERGCTMRTLYPYSARVGVVEPKWMRQMAKQGAAVRTLSIPFPRMIIVDRRHAFIEDLVIDGAPPNAGWYVTDRPVVEWISMIFDLYWARADTWSQPLDHSGHVTSPIQRAILRELVAGFDQKQIAGRLQISDKTLSNHLVDLRTKLGLRTTYQLMHWWATSQENSSVLELRPGEEPPNFPGP
ncbi:LuxR C-terminal-related transcriptional regulator [Streptomyces sp. 11x1]|uniref:helix-turn-helix transcriptional regulator n=1 Tax=Streptomyces sp. 11x1 TaxID=3038642 RepID=UPI002931EE05|nr:LuxR C-terminal-related transcriptional regulator [Streptomyces sp. 11x1]WNZ14875.1 LuxR C-terminal-related transcriptional regulator [Streptomyces sp. 11x1]